MRHQDLVDGALDCAMSVPDEAHGLLRHQRKEHLKFAIKRTSVPLGDSDSFLLIVRSRGDCVWLVRWQSHGRFGAQVA